MGAEEMRHRVVGQHDAPGVVRPEVHPDAVAHHHHGSVAPGPDLDVVHLMARVRGRHHVLAPVLRPLHRPAADDGGGGDEEILRIAGGLGAEAAAHVGGDHADLVGGQPEGGDQSLLDEVHHLGPVPGGEAPVARVPLGDHPARLHRHADITLHVEALAHAHVGGAQRGLRVAEAGLEVRARRCRPTPRGCTGAPASPPATMSYHRASGS